MHKNNISLTNLDTKKRLYFFLENPLKKVHPLLLLSTIKEIGESDCLELLEILPAKQVQSIIDYEVWDKYELDTNKLGEWLGLLFLANYETAIEQIYKLDREFLGLALKKCSYIYDLTLQEEPHDYPNLYSMCPDQRFLIAFKDDKELENLSFAMHKFVEALYGKDMKFILNLLEDVRFEQESLLEESCYNFKSHRLKDFGILSQEENLVLLSDINLKQLVKNNFVINNSQSLIASPYNFSLDKYVFLKSAFKDLNMEEANYYSEMISHIGINFHSLLSNNFGDKQEIKNTLSYSGFLIDLGLWRITQSNLSLSSQCLKEYGLQQLLRFGRSMLTALRKSAFFMLKDDNLLLNQAFSCADTPLREVAKAICSKEPLYYDGLLDANKFSVSYFTSHIQVQESIKALKELQYRSLILGPHGLGFTKSLFEENKHLVLTHTNMMATVLINRYLHNPDFHVLNNLDVENIFADKNHNKLKQEVIIYIKNHVNMLYKLLSNNAAQYAVSKDVVENFLNIILIKIEQNYQDSLLLK